MSNDPFADPSAGGGSPAAASTPSSKTNRARRESMPISDPMAEPTSPATVGPPSFSGRERGESGRSNRGSLQPGGATPSNFHHGRSLSSDPMCLDSPSTIVHHGRTVSADPLADSEGSSPAYSSAKGYSQQDADFTAADNNISKPTPSNEETPQKKKGFHFFKTKEEKELIALEAEETTARKSIDEERKTEWKKTVVAEWEASKKHFEIINKETKKESEKLLAEHLKVWEEIKKERKKEVMEMSQEFCKLGNELKAKEKEAKKKAKEEKKKAEEEEKRKAKEAESAAKE